ncbi:hypothetical protein C8R47DRAFT_1218996 [Mycena vitilis]|nr:hypothetical protein C8R47DRAFT_1218996 [Mycena vitilis]
MSKRKVTISIEEEDIDDGSGSDISVDDYTPRPGFTRVRNAPDEAITVARDGRLRSTFTAVPTPASPSKRRPGVLTDDVAPPPEPQYQSRAGWQESISEFDAEYGPGVQHAPRDLRPSDSPNALWVRDDRVLFLDELLRLDGRGEHAGQQQCAGEGCKATDFPYRCKDCLQACLYCKECVVRSHRRTPLHHIEKWSDGSFHRCTLKSLDLRIQLGHALGDRCYNPVKAHGDDFVIVNSHTIDEVNLDFCGCIGAKSHALQLLRMRMYPATGTYPRSAATFAALERFDLMTLESKCSAYEFYNSLARETDNTGAEPSRERYEEFLRMTRQWQNLHLLKRAGRAHDPAEDRIGATKEGECALLCPACPQPGKNLPPNWKDLPWDKAFIYALYLAIDANFRLKRRDVSTEAKDPGLGTGWSFFGEVKAYMAHLEKWWHLKQPRSTCVSHDAVDKPDRETLGTVSSGIGTVDCARHNMKRPLGVGDLQKGERYLNMDYMFFKSLKGTDLVRLFVSYDIACQWHKKLWGRMMCFEKGVQFVEGTKFVVFLVPKFHLPAHIELCNILFSFNLTAFVGRTDGEAPERGWADANRLANSTSISGPGARRDTLDNHFQWWNWKKIVALGTVLLGRIKKNVPLMLETRMEWVDMEASYPPSVIETWTAMAVLWEEDDTQPNPFKTEIKVDSLAHVKLRLAEIAQADVDHLRVRGDMHETEKLSMGLQLEEQQRDLATHVKKIGLHETVDQNLGRVDRETKLRRKIESWARVHQLFIPEASLLQERDDAARQRAASTQTVAGIQAQEMKLWLPSAIKREVRCDKSLQEYEYELRKGQAVAALNTMCDLLLVRTEEYKYRDAALRGVRAKTRSTTRVEGINARIDRAADEYRAARAALVSLGALLSRTDWEGQFRVLKADDVRPRPHALFGDEERQKGHKKAKRPRLDQGEAAEHAEMAVQDKRPLSWIWISQATAGDETDLVDNEALRVEWAKTRARAMRYSEEVDLLEEEMRRVVVFLDWRAAWWRSLLGLRTAMQPDAALQEGHAAYVHKQAGYMSGLADRFRKLWASVPEYLVMARAHYATLVPDEDEEREMASETAGEWLWE